MKTKNLLYVGALVFSNLALGTNVAVVTKAEGNVRLLYNPSASVSGSGPHLKYDSLYYNFKQVEPGDKVTQGSILQTGPASKAHVVYDNGDQFNVGPRTAYKIEWNSDQKAPKVDLKWGRIRGIISKKGQRHGLAIRTRSATMGVRGTDFFVYDRVTEGTEFTVLRGEVKVTPKAQEQKIIKVKAGQTADVAKPVETKAEGESRKLASTPEPVVRATSRVELKHIVSSSTVDKGMQKKSESEAVAKKVEALEKKALDTTLADIKYYDKDLYNQLKQEKPETVAEVSNEVVRKLAQVAPEEPPRAKPYQYELEGLGSDAYNKYFEKR